MTRPGLIFDLDGTLVDSLPGIAGSLNRSLQEHGFSPHPLHDVRRFIGNGSYELVRKALPPGAAGKVIFQVESAFKADYAATWPEGTAPYEGIPACLEALATSGFPLAVLSNKPHPFTVEIVGRLFPRIPFAPIAGQRDEIPRKPHPAGALEIARGWGISPQRCCFIGDSTVDLETARAAEIPFAAVGWGYHDLSALQDAGVEFVARKVTDLTRFLMST